MGCLAPPVGCPSELATKYVTLQHTTAHVQCCKALSFLLLAVIDDSLLVKPIPAAY